MMIGSRRVFRNILQYVVALACLRLAAPALGSDQPIVAPITSGAFELHSTCDDQGCPSLCKSSGIPPLTFQLGRAFDVRAGGFARLDVIHDFNAIWDRYEFLTTSIPTDGSCGSKTTVSARQTRFNLDITHSRSSLRVFAEGDFFGSGGDFRLRHAFGEFNGGMIGQNWSTFQDESIIPTTLDYEGPAGMVFVRQPQLRLTAPWNERVEYAFAIEDPSQSDSNVDIPFPGVDNYRLPDFVARLRVDLPSTHVQISSVVRELGFRSGVMPGQNVIGWGIAVSGSWQPRESDQLYAQAAFGRGFARYVDDLSGTGSDAALDLKGNLVGLPTVGIVAGWRHLWNSDVQSNLVFGFAEVSNSAGQLPGAFHRSEYAAGNVIWSPITNLDLGCEAIWGSRSDKNRAYGEAIRLQFTTTFSF